MSFWAISCLSCLSCASGRPGTEVVDLDAVGPPGAAEAPAAATAAAEEEGAFTNRWAEGPVVGSAAGAAAGGWVDVFRAFKGEKRWKGQRRG